QFLSGKRTVFVLRWCTGWLVGAALEPPSRRKLFSVSLVGSPTKPLTLTARYTVYIQKGLYQVNRLVGK
ncbi:MAG TPA: hypothetical protein VFQ23_07415, partial [Anaerolineales bacterium]|nr:hypothetical protein [Anaerolineales bacterium]